MQPGKAQRRDDERSRSALNALGRIAGGCDEGRLSRIRDRDFIDNYNLRR